MSRIAEAWQAQEEANEAQRDSEMEQAREEYEAEQDALPPHKRDDFAERMADHADFLRKAKRENGQ